MSNTIQRAALTAPILMDGHGHYYLALPVADDVIEHGGAETDGVTATAVISGDDAVGFGDTWQTVGHVSCSVTGAGIAASGVFDGPAGPIAGAAFAAVCNAWVDSRYE